MTQNHKKLRCGYTTGSCATAAAKAATQMLCTGVSQEEVSIKTPKGIILHLNVEEISIDRDECSKVKKVTCAIRKDGGDDIDATHGALVFAEVEFDPASNEDDVFKDIKNTVSDALSDETVSDFSQVRIFGGIGVGKVTKPGLDQPIGEAAINSTPRRMITEAVLEVLQEQQIKRSVNVTISVPEGLEIAKKTFNPRLGIVGGISILGTSGIVMPMSETALLDSMRAEMRMLHANGGDYLVITPGNYGETFAKHMPGLDLTYEMKSSNFIGQTIDMAVDLGVKGILFISHIGKFIKVSGGIMNTHSHEADCRAELMAAAALRAGIHPEIVNEILETNTTEDALQILFGKAEQDVPAVMKSMTDRIQKYLDARGRQDILLGAIVFSSIHGELGRTDTVSELLNQIKQQENHHE